jgi:hypothetical protein
LSRNPLLIFSLCERLSAAIQPAHSGLPWQSLTIEAESLLSALIPIRVTNIEKPTLHSRPRSSLKGLLLLALLPAQQARQRPGHHTKIHADVPNLLSVHPQTYRSCPVQLHAWCCQWSQMQPVPNMLSKWGSLCARQDGTNGTRSWSQNSASCHTHPHVHTCTSG